MILLYIITSPLLQIKYKEDWEKSKSKACDIGVDTLTFKAAKQSRDLASDVSQLNPRSLFSGKEQLWDEIVVQNADNGWRFQV